jgi:hypothetical protein
MAQETQMLKQVARVITMINGKGFTGLLSSYEDSRDSFLPDRMTNICTTYSTNLASSTRNALQ